MKNWMVFPNAEALGYYRASLRDKDLARESNGLAAPNSGGIGNPLWQGGEARLWPRRNEIRRCIAAVAAIIFAISNFAGCSTNDGRTSGRSAAPAALLSEAKAEIVLPPGASAPPAPFEGEGWQSLFDGHSLAGWRETAFAGHGEAACRSGVMLLSMGNPFTGVSYTNDFPKVNYEIAFDAMRVTGSDFFCGLTVPVGDSFCSLIVGGWGGSLVGISSLDHMDASENETTHYMNFEHGRWYRIRLRITQEKIEAWIDKDKLVDVAIAGRTISLRPGEIEMSRPFGLACWETASALREIKMRRVEGPDTPVKKEQ